MRKMNILRIWTIKCGCVNSMVVEYENSRIVEKYYKISNSKKLSINEIIKTYRKSHERELPFEHLFNISIFIYAQIRLMHSFVLINKHTHNTI